MEKTCAIISNVHTIKKHMEYLYDSRIVWWCVVHFTVQPQASQASAFCLSALFETFCRINDWPKAWALENPFGTSPWACNALQCLPCQACICTDNAAPNHEASGCKCTQVHFSLTQWYQNKYTRLLYQIPPQVFHCHQALEPCRCLAVDAATDPTFRRGPKLGQSFDARSSEEKKGDAFASFASVKSYICRPPSGRKKEEVWQNTNYTDTIRY